MGRNTPEALNDTAAVAPGLSDRSGGAGQAPPPLNVDLPAEVLDEIWSDGHLDETASGRRHFIVEAEKSRESGNVVLKLAFMKPDYYLRLLTTEEVCEMLHISKSTVYGYARNKDLKTYRMGRGLRFRFQDVLDFLTGCQAGGD